MIAAQAHSYGLLACLMGAPLTALMARNRAAAGWTALAATVISSAFALVAACGVLWSGEPGTVVWLEMPSLALAVRFHIDGLSALFLGIIAVVAPACALFSIRYMEHHADYGVGRYHVNFLIFLAGMYGLVAVTDTMWVFMVFWQMMTVSSYLLIRFEHRRASSVRAANRYMVMMQLACALAMIGAALLAPGAGAGRYEFDALASNVPHLAETRPFITGLAFALFLAGFGIKAGMWPFGQAWLPDAHPAAPSPVSALLSGVMIKTGVYGLMRCFLWLIPAGDGTGFPTAEWGAVIAILGTITLFTGTAGALMQRQTKRLLAFSSIGQIGYILFGLGVGLSLLPSQNVALVPIAAIGLGAALFHTINHSLFKSLLFLNSGSLLWTTDTQDINKLGGLWRLMPWTGITALIAALSVSGVPLTNGFASKWGICAGAILGTPGARYLAPCAAVAILTSALTLAAFVKFFGASFLSRMSAWVREKAGGRGSLEPGWMMLAPQIFLACACIALGLFPALGFKVAGAAILGSPGGFHDALAAAWPLGDQGFWGIGESGGAALVVPVALLSVMGTAFVLAMFISRLGRARSRAGEPWLCGYVSESECHRYRADGFYGELTGYLKWAGIGREANRRQLSSDEGGSPRAH